jgi:hypothetical protein
MESFQIDILNPKAIALLNDLAAQKLIAMKPAGGNTFLSIVEKLRDKASKENVPTPEEIEADVQAVRTKRYAK